jgi:hypothetical protein
MMLTKIHATAAITAIILVIAIATATTSFPNATTAFATFLGSEQLGDNATTGTTTPPGAAAGDGQQQQQQTVHITKHGTNTYVISGSSSSVGSFDTTYRIVGERSAVRGSENLIISTITEDFRNSPTIGYVRAGTTTGGAAQDTTTLPNPFASNEQITERITSELRRVIGEAENNTAQGQLVDIKCDFGMVLDDMRCHHNRLVGAGEGAAGGSAATTPTNTTGTTADTTAPLAP